MSSGLEAIGDAATGALVAHAVEPRHGADAGSHGGTCLNCGATLVGPYCHGCGQNSHIHRTIAGFGHDLLHGVFHFEGKIWNTLPLLIFKPGELTRRYVHGERAKFVSPLAGFLFCTFLMFAIVGSFAGEMQVTDNGKEGLADVNLNVVTSRADLEKKIAQADEQVADLKTRIAAERRLRHDTGALDDQLDTARDRAEGLHTALRMIPAGAKSARIGGSQINGTLLGFKTGWAPLDHGIAKANENPNLFLYRLQSSAYKYSWALIPISTPLVWLLFFWKRKYKVYDHLVFVTFSLTFMTLLVTALTILGAVGVGGGLIFLLVLIIPPLHIYRQLRGAYPGSRVGALLRTGALLVMGTIALTLYVLLLLALGVFH